LLICAVLVLYDIFRAIYIAFAPSPSLAQSPALSWKEYVCDEFLGIKWRWIYSPWEDRPVNLAPFCPRCDFQIFPRASGYVATERVDFPCENCGFTRSFDMTYDELENRVHRSIQLNLRNGSWKAILARQTEAAKSSNLSIS
jgi:hypothetical protein